MRIKNSSKMKVKLGNIFLPVMVTDNCPKCKNEVVVNFHGDSQYMRDAISNEPFTLQFTCKNCDTNWESKDKVIIRASLRRVEQES